MDNPNFDNKKIIQMVAVIGLLCLFVGIAARIRQNNQKTLADTYNSKESSASIGSDADTENSSDDANSSGASCSSDTSSSSDASVGSNTSGISEAEATDNSGSNGVDSDSTLSGSSLSDISDEEYDAFYYVDNSDGTSVVNLLYYDYSHNVTAGRLECESEQAYELMLIFYKLYKNHYEFSSIIPLSEYEDEDACRAANNTYCFDGTVYINPLYNPRITYENDTAICTPEASAAYADRTGDFPYKITNEDYAYTLLTDAGYYWGGNRNGSKDYSSFSK